MRLVRQGPQREGLRVQPRMTRAPEIVRWIRPLGDFAYFARRHGTRRSSGGDTTSDSAIGDVSTLYVNGTQIAQATDATCPDGTTPAWASIGGHRLRSARRLRLHELHGDRRRGPRLARFAIISTATAAWKKSMPSDVCMLEVKALEASALGVRLGYCGPATDRLQETEYRARRPASRSRMTNGRAG